MADRLKRRASATTGKTWRLPRRTSLGAYLGGDEAAEAEYAYQRLQEAFARPLPLPLRDARFGYDNAGATHDEHLGEGDRDVGGLLRDYFVREHSPAPKGARLGTTQASREPLDDQETSVLADVARGGAAGVRRGTEGLAGTFGDFNQLRGDMAAYTADKVFGASPETQKWISDSVRRAKMPFMLDTSMAPTSDEIHQSTTSLFGESYQPQTTWGNYSRSMGEMASNMVGGGGKLIPRLLKDVVLPGLASETAGQLVEGTFLEPYVRGAAQMVTPLASSRFRRTLMPHRDARQLPNASADAAPSHKGSVSANHRAARTRNVAAKKGARVRSRKPGSGITAFGTHEMTPGVTTGHLPAVARGSEAVRDAYAADPRSWWLTPDRRDILYSAQGASVDKSLPMIGLFEGQFNPGQVATPRVRLSGPKGERVVAPSSSQMMTGTEAFRAYMDAQDAGAWSTAIHGQHMGHNNAYEVALGERMRTPAGLTAAKEASGMPDAMHYGGQRAVVTDFVNPPRLSVSLNRQIDARMREQVGSGVTPVHRDGHAVFFTEKWPKGEGSEEATRWMLEHLDDAQIEALDTPSIRRKVLDRLEQDAEISARLGTPVRQDIQTARRVFAVHGFKGLKAALGQGILPVAVAAVFLSHLQDDRT
jgi:hypothetical protein